MTINKEFLRIKDACQYIGIAKSTFWLWVKKGKLPQGTQLSTRCRVWSVKELREFIESHEKKEG